MHPKNPSAATDVANFFEDIEAGRFEQMISAGISQTAASVVGTEKKGQVVITLDIEGIKGASQVRIGHKIKFTKPTERGAITEHDESSTVFFVGKAGALSLAQPSLLDKQGALGGIDTANP